MYIRLFTGEKAISTSVINYESEFLYLKCYNWFTFTNSSLIFSVLTSSFSSDFTKRSVLSSAFTLTNPACSKTWNLTQKDESKLSTSSNRANLYKFVQNKRILPLHIFSETTNCSLVASRKLWTVPSVHRDYMHSLRSEDDPQA